MRFSRRVRKIVARQLVKRFPPEIVMLLRGPSVIGPAFAPRNLVVTRQVPSGGVLVLAPHPDDEVIGLGGVINIHLANRSAVCVVYMTNARGGERTNSLTAARRKEAESIGREFGLQQVFWDEEDTQLTNNDSAVSQLSALLRSRRPSVIYVPSFFEHHFDHFSANQILIDAMQAARFECSDLLCYELWDNIPLPNYVVDISDQFERKLRMLSYYETPLKLTDYGQLCRNRNGLNHFLHVDPRRGQPGFAEVFHRFDSDTYQQIYSNYVKVLQEQGSSLTAHISVR